jgi:protein gp37
MRLADWHTYQVLTKRPARMKKLLKKRLKDAAQAQHIWWGVSVENRKHGLPRLRMLQETPAVMRFLSCEPLLEDLGELDLTGIHWVIVGGESGPRARPMEHDWVISIREQCQAQGVPFFFKQWGGVQKSKTGRRLDGQTYDEFPKETLRQIPGIAERRKVKVELDQYLGGDNNVKFGGLSRTRTGVH